MWSQELNYSTPKSLGKGSDFYGQCEVCGLRVSDMHISDAMQPFEHEGATHYAHRSTTFGHEECLNQKQN